jgi:hypothetical protein
MTAPFSSPESKAAFNEVRDFILAKAPPGIIDGAAFSLIELPPDEVDRRIAAMCETVEAEVLRTNPAVSPSVAFAIPFVSGAMIRERLREIESQRGYA